MEKQTSILGKAKPLFSFQWQYNFLINDFVYDAELAEFLGYKDDASFTFTQLFAACHFQQVEQFKAEIKQVLASHQDSFDYLFINTPNGDFLAQICIHYINEPKRQLSGEINILKSLPVEFAQAQQFRLLLEKAKHGFMICSPDHYITFVNDSFCQACGYPQQELLGQHADILNSGNYTQEFYQKLWAKVDAGESWKGELLAKNKQGEIYAQQAEIQRIAQNNGQYFYVQKSERLDISNYSLIHKDRVGERRKANICSKKEFTEKVTKEYKGLSNTETLALAVFVVKTQQKTTKNAIRWLISERFDAYSRGGHLGLINEDIFAICFVVEKKIDKVDTLLSQTLKALAGGESGNEFDVISNVKMAASVLFVDGKSIQQLLINSVQKLLATPFSESASLTYFDPRLSKRFNRRKVLAKLLNEAVNKGQVEVYYQPIIDIKNMRLSKFEALFRISLDTEIDYTIQELITIAEEYNWVNKIDNLVSRIALNGLTLLQKYYGDQDIGMSLNRSLANDSQSFSCLEETFKTLREMDVDLNNVTLELTESAFFENAEQQNIWIDKLKQLGVKISLDDFGTGYSSLSYLKNLPINFVKIDRSFVTNLTAECNEYQIIKMLCKLTHKIGGKVIAEGVETAEELKLIARAQVDMVQGYIFSKPVSLEALLSTPKILVNKTLRDLIHEESDHSVRDIMSREFRKVSSEARLSDALKRMEQHEIDHLLVFDGSKCCGVVYAYEVNAALSPYIGSQGETARDLATLNKRIHQVMNKEFNAVDIDSPIEQVQEIFLNHPHGVIVVTGSGSDVCHGVVSLSDFLKYKYMQDE